jgi:lipopolysaccharide/colanic/teichoic acid biosynthesis glycosyltransferase
MLALVLIDALCLLLAVNGASALRLVTDGLLPTAALPIERHIIASLLAVPTLLILFQIHGLYDADRILVGTREYARIANAASYGVLIALAVSFFTGNGPLISRSWILLAWVLTIVCAGIGRFAVRRLVRQLREQGSLRTRVIIVGASSFGVAIAEQLRDAKREGLDIVGFLDEYLPLGEALLPDVSVIGRPSDLVRNPGADLADEYILVPAALPHQRIEDITRLMVTGSGPVLRMAISTSDLLTRGLLVAERGGVPLVTLRRARLVGLDSAMKRLLDLVGASLAGILLAPLGLVAVARSYLAGNRTLLSREYVSGASGDKVPLWLLDRGVTTWLPLRGAPALLAVLRGQLSLVGPRPLAWSPERSSSAALWLIGAKPGLTGPWRVTGAEASLTDQAARDLAYIRNYSIWEDLRLLTESLRRLRPDRILLPLARWERRSVGGGVPMGEATGLLESGAMG